MARIIGFVMLATILTAVILAWCNPRTPPAPGKTQVVITFTIVPAFVGKTPVTFEVQITDGLATPTPLRGEVTFSGTGNIQFDTDASGKATVTARAPSESSVGKGTLKVTFRGAPGGGAFDGTAAVEVPVDGSC